jgi:catechol 2,3-dioxygenase-like lactoylglutathione lyase family enzyme
MASVEKLGNVFYRVADVASAVEFYTSTLGLPVKFRDGDPWVAFDVAGVTLAIEPLASGPAPGGATVSLHVSGLDDLVSQLPSRGTPVSDVRKGPHERLAEVRDPSGNVLVLYEPLARP